MILRAIPLPSPDAIDEILLTTYDSYLFMGIAVLLIIVFIKLKYARRNPNDLLGSQSDPNEEFEWTEYDVLMQPKK